MSRDCLQSFAGGLATCAFVLLALDSAAQPDSVMQPTDPCEVVRCPPSALLPSPYDESFEFASDDRPRSDSAMMALSKAHSVLVERVAANHGSVEVSDSDLARLLRCRDAVKAYRPEKRGGLEPIHRSAYLEACLDPVASPPDAVGRTLLEATGFLVQQQCNAGILGSRRIVTARHCFARVPPRGRSRDCQIDRIDRDELANAVVTGIGADGQRWSVAGLVVAEDPTQPASRFRTANEEIVCEQPARADFLVLEPADPNATFGSPRSGSISIGGAESLDPEERLLVAWLDGRLDRLYVDHLASCLVVESRPGWFAHHCQAVPGSSGALIYRDADDRPLEIVGLHVAGAGHVEGVFHPGSNEALFLPAGALASVPDPTRRVSGDALGEMGGRATAPIPRNDDRLLAHATVATTRDR